MAPRAEKLARPRPAGDHLGVLSLLQRSLLLVFLALASSSCSAGGGARREDVSAPPPSVSCPAASVCDEPCGGGGPSCVDLAAAHWTGNGARQDRGAAVRILRRACDAGDALACLHDSLIEEPPVPPRGGPRLARACELGSFAACLLARRVPLPVRAICQQHAECEDGCRRGVPTACTELARRYKVGESGTPADPARADQMFREQCAHGNGGGCTFLALADESPARRPDAIALATRGCDLGDPMGCMMASALLDEAQPPPRTELVLSLLERACRGGASPMSCDSYVKHLRHVFDPNAPVSVAPGVASPSDGKIMSALNDDEQAEFCDFAAALGGGYGQVKPCPGGGAYGGSSPRNHCIAQKLTKSCATVGEWKACLRELAACQRGPACDVALPKMAGKCP